MLSSLEISNYRNLDYLGIKRLGRVNLFLGKNNTGKTSVLEAIAININKGSIEYLLQLLEERGENYIRNEKTNISSIKNIKESTVLRTLSALFTNYQTPFKLDGTILISEYNVLDFGLNADTIPTELPPNATIINFARYLEEYDKSGIKRRKKLPEDTDNPSSILEFESRSGQSIFSIPLRNIKRLSHEGSYLQNSPFDIQIAPHQFIKTKNIERDLNSFLWDKIALTEGEDEVLEALRIIEPSIDRITFRIERERERVPIVRLKSSNEILPLSSMGDGINRILTIILAMVNCENGYFLIDEFENGLHYSIQERLWEVIFKVAERLNIQVFATTHSYDCIDAFANILSREQYKEDFGYMIRLDNYNGRIEATLYNSDEIQTTTRVHVDPR